MRARFTLLLAAVALLMGVATGSAQQTGEIAGRVTDATSAILPGVTVTLSGPALQQPLTAVTSETGSYQFPRLPIGTYSMKFELPGFSTVVRDGIIITIGFTANISQQMSVSQIEETLTVSSESPIVDTRDTGTQTTFSRELLQTLPTARDPWVILEQTPGIAMDRTNVGGSQSGQQSGTSRAVPARATTSGRLTASTSPTCRQRAPRRSTTTSTCSKKCRS